MVPWSHGGMPGAVPAGVVPEWSRGKTGTVPGPVQGRGSRGWVWCRSGAGGVGMPGMPGPVWGEAGGGPRAEGMPGAVPVAGGCWGTPLTDAVGARPSTVGDAGAGLC